MPLGEVLLSSISWALILKSPPLPLLNDKVKAWAPPATSKLSASTLISPPSPVAPGTIGAKRPLEPATPEPAINSTRPALTVKFPPLPAPKTALFTCAPPATSK